MGRFVLSITNRLAVLGAKFGIFDRDCLVDGGMACDVRRVVRKRTQGECILVRVLRLEQQFTNEVPAADVVHQVAEFSAAEGVITEILNDGTAIGVGVSFAELIFRHARKSFQEEGLDLTAPDQVDDLLMSKNRIRERSAGTHHDEKKKCNHSENGEAAVATFIVSRSG